ncbi:MAG: hypothetical protein M5U26_30720 [Planctomycetota bacterium]|nr:hypothetical protein [Planctomycetota bacterium]
MPAAADSSRVYHRLPRQGGLRRHEPVRKTRAPRAGRRERLDREDGRERFAAAPKTSATPLVLAGLALAATVGLAAFVLLGRGAPPTAAPVSKPQTEAAPAKTSTAPAQPAEAPQPAPVKEPVAPKEPAPAKTERPVVASEPNPRLRLFPSLGLSHLSQFEDGTAGHFAQADDVWTMRVQGLEQGANQHRLTLAIEKVLKGQAQPDDRTLILGCVDPKREFGLTPGATDAARFVVFLTADNRFFMLTAEDYAKATAPVPAPVAAFVPPPEAPAPSAESPPVEAPVTQAENPFVPETPAGEGNGTTRGLILVPVDGGNQ